MEKELESALQKARVLVVGAGGIGCELIKDLALLKVGHMTVVDLDTIDVSNLNRQFLFRKHHVDKPKAEVGAEAGRAMNPEAEIVHFCGNIKDSQFSAEFFSSFDVVLNALDNLDARKHVNRMCLAAERPLIEAGSTGYLGQSRVIYKGRTECYECEAKRAPKVYPVCTIRSTPSSPVHCIQWAKMLFDLVFGSEEDGNLIRDMKDALTREEGEEPEFAAQRAFDHLFNVDIQKALCLEDLWADGMREDASAEIARLLSERLGEAENYALDIAYKAPPPPKEMVRTPEMCEAEIAEAQRDYGKITFEPGSATIAAVSLDTMNAIAEILAECGEIKLEIQGHTDSQGRTSMNQQLSQDRAHSALNELHARRILTASYTAKGYGEDQPIAPNDTEEGREANRRIEIRLIRPEPVAEAVSTLEAVAQETTKPGEPEKAPADAEESSQEETENGRD